MSLNELKQQLDIDGADDDNDVDLQRALDAAAAAIDNACGRTFRLSSADETKLYYPNTAWVLDVIDLVSVTSVKVDTDGDRTYATTLATTDYELLPYNEARYQQLRIWPTSSHTFSPGWLAQVVGRFGYVEGADVSDPDPANWIPGTAPWPVKQANLLLGARYYKRREAPFGILSAADIGAFARLAREDPDVASLLQFYSLNTSWVAV